MKVKPQVLLLLLMGFLASISLAQQSTTWTDPATGLMWTAQDNGNSVTSTQATNYCANLRLESYSDWRLPTIDELAELYDETQNVYGFHIKGSIRLSVCCLWSCSKGHDSGSVWIFGFADGKRSSPKGGDSLGHRALCVRRSGE